MDEKLTDELIDSILSPLKAAEARSLALVRALTETGLLREEQLKPFLDQADSASEIKERGLRIRLKRVIADIAKQAENARKREDDKKQSESKEEERAEGPQQDPQEEAREHPKTDATKDSPKSVPQGKSQNDAKEETVDPAQVADESNNKSENAA